LAKKKVPLTFSLPEGLRQDRVWPLPRTTYL
jgi:hypothetical protein